MIGTVATLGKQIYKPIKQKGRFKKIKNKIKTGQGVELVFLLVFLIVYLIKVAKQCLHPRSGSQDPVFTGEASCQAQSEAGEPSVPLFSRLQL